ncbi:MAG: 30S ribosomal protein S19e [Candidatus Nanohaloarchaeota archaeon QJJ-9]|nr:30S ribosomal protein S19e [Candidatus Nanohaloarchaeota archaeon QJJ-9]
MVTVYDVRANPLIEKTAEKLEEEVEEVDAPEWAEYVKTGVSRERTPEQDNWWYLRTAAILRKLYMDGPLGVEKLRTVYGSRQKRGHQTEHFNKASGKVIRTVLQQLNDTELVGLEEGEGRKVTPEGQSFMDELAEEVHE